MHATSIRALAMFWEASFLLHVAMWMELFLRSAYLPQIFSSLIILDGFFHLSLFFH